MNDTQPSGALTLIGQLTVASNVTFLARWGDTSVVYKPVSGEKPLWDFPHGQLAGRERAAYLVSEALGWNIVPPTWLGSGPLGPGMVQLWQEIDRTQDAVDLVAIGSVPPGWRHALDGRDEQEQDVSLVHEDSVALRRMALFDVVINNADRKGSHVLEMPGGHRFGIDHGVTFHEEHKLRTVLWGWVGEPLTQEELAALTLLCAHIDGPLGAELAELLTEAEIEAFAMRCDRLRSQAQFPEPSGDMPPVPWPLF
ncbi:SCO1664 family protein [Rathayibacter toxicus]|uniref:Phosphatidylinositol kinase n=1 Tax=Rathayibacter toxicus TaxID=145458 RepID=A0A0C5BFS3_9MICO|nr:SCO1664 family protein [Rathayibacter toxicus]AJM78241.1 phosphatidylinositol kinase [Rathayibacter toxicus]ALS57465.1 phosphatidylinositol kinase [Rathayibacter toxicus]KKM46824.1 phosphatidylinositol kinase [Rathayibacter toxicus]PPG20870.1 phosphatidylinositol kinase [Rathayibacter toxicus]PPG45973.1 phosphatidylinositol kinase [Rathayibacter toxicus]